MTEQTIQLRQDADRALVASLKQEAFLKVMQVTDAALTCQDREGDRAAQGVAEQEELLSVGQAQEVGLRAVVGRGRVHKGVERVDQPRRDLHKLMGPASWLCSATRWIFGIYRAHVMSGLWSKHVAAKSPNTGTHSPGPGLEQKRQV